MMEIVVHGTKQGYKSSFISNRPPSFALGDIRNGVNDENPLGNSAYTLAFINGGCVYSKYTIIRDTLRSYATGNIAFSIYLPRNIELLSDKGGNIISLLDELSNHYIEKYVKDKNINRGESALIHEDWSYVGEISRKYSENEKNRKDEEISSGNLDPAIHYYNSIEELIKHFDNPYHEEYSDYKQILFIDSKLKGRDNPINVLKNSGVEVNPDLNNEYFYLNNYNKNKGVKISAYYNNMWHERTDVKGYNRIRANWPIEIKLIKEYYKKIFADGSISNLASNIHQYLDINGNNIKIIYEAFHSEPEETTIKINVIRKDGNRINESDVKIKVENRSEQVSLQAEFKGEELGREYKIEARIGNLFYGEAKIIPKDKISSPTITIELIEKRVVKITVYEAFGDKKELFDFDVIVPGKILGKRTNAVTFSGEEIKKKWQIRVERNGYIQSAPIPYTAENGEDEILFFLKKRDNQIPDEKPRKGGATSPEVKNKQKTTTERIKQIFSKPVFIASSVISILVIGIVIWALNNYNEKETSLTKEHTISDTQITLYVEGNELNLDTLGKYLDKWNSQEQNFITKPDGGFFGGDERVDSTKWEKDWKPFSESIERAIIKRKLINNKDFAKLLKQRYSDGQLPFKKVVEKIDSSKFDEIDDSLGNVSNLPLSEITEKINQILQSIANTKSEAQEEVTPGLEEKKLNQKKEKTIDTKHSTDESSPVKKRNNASDINSEIISYIKGSELDIVKLEKYKNTNGISSNLKQSIQLCIDFWDLDGSGKGKQAKTYYSFQSKLKGDKNFQGGSKILAFVERMCHLNDNALYGKQDKIKGLKQ